MTLPSPGADPMTSAKAGHLAAACAKDDKESLSKIANLSMDGGFAILTQIQTSESSSSSDNKSFVKEGSFTTGKYLGLEPANL
mmetsp:Transcript_40130/g.60644  ORF Transcript_40130/g.60644 Transcript_40130/m.60644 type:complete len:83 (-) Transcript_40130:71-319(-)|eukprot:CAMPEP_0194748826 /NCGR_PEP_ID=MMETSP0323_2-20130528/3004_1 /TAXON_ID=2866 ORGANISM="Crypthecodinium cohnii, Strain Seligo" /NCGR_SAMPLE_ID=MMETSP0323_2 /ASSEMBLY_ACC=CAM_ASM_000346 /LENGTH=82 /DNA_ID=CAMNT_0039663431 /DNA_START=436 /DNA_END=684 /DNA_ORIENTATION=+